MECNCIHGDGHVFALAEEVVLCIADGCDCPFADRPTVEPLVLPDNRRGGKRPPFLRRGNTP